MSKVLCGSTTVVQNSQSQSNNIWMTYATFQHIIQTWKNIICVVLDPPKSVLNAILGSHAAGWKHLNMLLEICYAPCHSNSTAHTLSTCNQCLAGVSFTSTLPDEDKFSAMQSSLAVGDLVTKKSTCLRGPLIYWMATGMTICNDRHNVTSLPIYTGCATLNYPQQCYVKHLNSESGLVSFHHGSFMNVSCRYGSRSVTAKRCFNANWNVYILFVL